MAARFCREVLFRKSYYASSVAYRNWTRSNFAITTWTFGMREKNAASGYGYPKLVSDGSYLEEHQLSPEQHWTRLIEGPQGIGNPPRRPTTSGPPIIAWDRWSPF
jgi:hypothetical protein